jgi:hypothetical protein
MNGIPVLMVVIGEKVVIVHINFGHRNLEDEVFEDRCEDPVKSSEIVRD